MSWALLALATLLLAGCESSQDKSARLAKSAVAGKHEKGIVVTASSPDVKVLKTAVVEDQYGAAAAVQLGFSGKKPQAAMPISFELRDAAGKKAYANDLPGLAASPFRIFWIGNPKGAQLRIFAPPTVLTKEAP